MISPIDQIEEGILEGDWEAVRKGFEKLTGKSIPCPPETSLDAIQKIHDIAATILGLDAIAEICGEETEDPKKGKKTGKKTKKTKKTRNKKTKSISKEGEDSSIILADNKRTPGPRDVGTVQHITNVPDPGEVERNKVKAAKTGRSNLVSRPVAKKYKVKCNECQDKFDSDRPKGEMGQKCPKCLSGRKSQFV